MPDNKALLAFAKKQIRRLDARIAATISTVEHVETSLSKLILEGLIEGNLFRPRERRRRSQEAQRILRQLYLEADAQIPDLVLDHFLLGQRLVEVGSGLRKEQMSQYQKEAVRLLQEALTHNLHDAGVAVGRRVDDVFRKEGLRSALARAEGSSVEKASAAFRRNLVRDGITSFVDASGRRWSLTHYSRMAVNTVTAEAQNSATRLVMVQKELDVVQFNSVKDPCVECLPYDGKEFSLIGRTPDLPQLKAYAPFHGSCRHFMFPTVRSVQEREATQVEVPA